MKIKKFGWIIMMCTAIAIGNVMSSCSDDTNGENGGNGGNGSTDPEVTYDGTTAYSKGVLFNNGTELGNGDQHFVFTGDVTLEKGTYLLKGWVYVADGAKLRIPAGTIIKGDKQTMASLIIEPGGYVEMKGTKEAPIVMTSEEAPGQRRPGDWGGLIICGKAKNNQGTQQIEADRAPYTEAAMMPTIPVSSSISAWSLQVIPLKQTKRSTALHSAPWVVVPPSTTYRYRTLTTTLSNGSAVQ